MKHSCVNILILICFLGSVANASDPNVSKQDKTEGLIASPFETILIHGGTFKIGTKVTKKRHPLYHADEAPLEVVVKSFRIGKFPITAEQMCQFLNSPEAKTHKIEELYHHEPLVAVGSGKELPYSTIGLMDGVYVPRENAAKTPANQATWKGAVLFCQWLSDKSGKKYRLPSEAEWEYAARGKEGRTYPWGEEVPEQSDKIGERYNYRQNRKPLWCTSPVGTHPKNATPEGVMDMCAYIIGEWCANKYIENPTAQQAVDIRVDLEDLETHRVVRGYYQRWRNERSSILSFFFESLPHIGCAWTRMHSHPIEVVKHEARHGFRVVEEDSKPNGDIKN